MDRKATWLNQQQIRGLAFRFIFHRFFDRLAVVQVLFCSLTTWLIPNICWFCLVLINSVLLNLLCVWMSDGDKTRPNIQNDVWQRQDLRYSTIGRTDKTKGTDRCLTVTRSKIENDVWQWKKQRYRICDSDRSKDTACVAVTGPKIQHVWQWQGQRYSMCDSDRAKDTACVTVTGPKIQDVWQWQWQDQRCLTVIVTGPKIEHLLAQCIAVRR